MATALESLGTTLMISAEGSDRTDLVLDIYDRLLEHHQNVGVTLQARLHRSSSDLDRLLSRPGKIRLVKGAFAEHEAVAFPRGSGELRQAYLNMAETPITSGHPVSIATHDADLIDSLIAAVPEARTAPSIEFEMLLGLGTSLLDRLHSNGYRTREYSIFGDEWWLYVLNRVAEQPQRVFDAILDLGARSTPPAPPR
jgi:proline dehydrogenase